MGHLKQVDGLLFNIQVGEGHANNLVDVPFQLESSMRRIRAHALARVQARKIFTRTSCDFIIKTLVV